MGSRPARAALAQDGEAASADEAPQLPRDAAGPFRRGVDEGAWLEVNNAALRGHPENGDLTREDPERRMAMDWFDPEGCAWRGEARRFCWTGIHPRCDEIYIIGLHPDSGPGTAASMVLSPTRG